MSWIGTTKNYNLYVQLPSDARGEVQKWNRKYTRGFLKYIQGVSVSGVEK